MLSGKKGADEELTKRIMKSNVEPPTLTRELHIKEEKKSMLEVNMIELTELVRECNHLEKEILNASRNPCQMFYAMGMVKQLFTREAGSRSASSDSLLILAYTGYYNWLKAHYNLLCYEKK